MNELAKNQHLADECPSSNVRAASGHIQHQGECAPEQSISPDQAHERVGYRSPPREHRFKKGQSGNPRGRPRKSLNRQTVIIRTLNDAALAEGQRVIAVGQGPGYSLTTVMEAVLRGISEKAIKGDTACSRLLLQFVSSAQKQKAEGDLVFFKAWEDYKSGWEKEIRRCYEERQPFPELPLPHPDDVLVNPRTGEVTIVGPMTKEEKVITDRMVEERDQLIAFLEMPNHLAMAKPHLRHQIRARQGREIEELNALLPPRLRRTYDGPID